MSKLVIAVAVSRTIYLQDWVKAKSTLVYPKFVHNTSRCPKRSTNFIRKKRHPTGNAVLYVNTDE